MSKKQKQFLAWTAAALVFGAIAYFTPHPPPSLPPPVSGPVAHAPATCAEFAQYYHDTQKEWDTLAQHPGLILFGSLVVVAGLVQIARWMHTALRGMSRLFLYGWGWAKSVSGTR